MADKVLINDEVEVLAQILYKAYKSQEPLEMSKFEAFDDDSAYRVQRRLMELKVKKLGGYKISLTSEETQKMFNSTEPLYGAQLDERFFRDQADLPFSMFMDPLVEVELVFTAKTDLAADDDFAALMEKTTVAPAVELPDCRFKEWFPTLPKNLVMADAAVGGEVVYGKEHDTTDFDFEELAEVSTQLFHDGEQVAEGKSSEVLGNPLKSLHWLTEKLAETDQVVQQGQHVSTGTFLLPVPLKPGKWEAKFDHELGNVAFTVK